MGHRRNSNCEKNNLKPSYHLAVSSLIAGGSYAATQSPLLAVSTFAVGFLIDGDHLFDYAIYCFQKRRWPSFWQFYHASGPIDEPPAPRIYVPLHAYELILPIWLIAAFFSAFPWAVWLSLSFGGHLLMDQLAHRPHPLCYSLIFRTIRGFSSKTAWRCQQKTSKIAEGR